MSTPTNTTVPDLRAAAQQALQALEHARDYIGTDEPAPAVLGDVLDAIKELEALQQPAAAGSEQDPLPTQADPAKFTFQAAASAEQTPPTTPEQHAAELRLLAAASGAAPQTDYRAMWIEAEQRAVRLADALNGTIPVKPEQVQAWLNKAIESATKYEAAAFRKGVEAALRHVRDGAAAPAAAQPDLKLDKPAKVGAARFGVGVSQALVIRAAQRLHEAEVTPEKEAERIAAGRESLALLQQHEAARFVDAMRYRWLRNQAVRFGHEDNSPSPWVVIGTSHNKQEPCEGAELDAAVDAARLAVAMVEVAAGAAPGTGTEAQP